jgi:prephenate dehydrogenase
MSNFEDTVKKISKKVNKNCLILDVCSLKSFSEKVMLKYLDNKVNLIGTHPLFGPKSASKGIKGMNICLVNVRCEEVIFNKTTKFLERIGLNVIITNSKAHDKEMALSQALTHFIGRSIDLLKIPDIILKTKTYNSLIEISKIISKDSDDLFYNIQNKNPYAKKIRNNYVNIVTNLNKKIEKK